MRSPGWLEGTVQLTGSTGARSAHTPAAADASGATEAGGRRRLKGRGLVALGTCLAGVAGCANAGIFGGPSVTTVAVAHSATVGVKYVQGFGNILVTGAGFTLYLLASDPSGGSNCTGPCSLSWPPLEVSGKMKAGPGVNASLLSSFARSGGGRQVLYNKHALYTFEEDTGPGMVTGEGNVTYGGTWWVVSPSGRAVTK